MREDALDALTELGDDLGHALTGLSEGGTMNVGLRGDASHIQAGSAHLSFLDDGDLQSLLRSIFSSTIASWACTDDEDISG